MSDSTAPPEQPDPELEAAFRAALRQVATTSSGTASRAGQVRVKLVDALGPERAAALRARVHQAVVAAEEQIPASLSALAPLSDATLDRLAAELAGRRGWTPAVGRRTTLDWAAALGLTTQPDSWNPPARGPR